MCFIIVCGAAVAYQRAACDGFYHCIEDVDRKSQQRRPTVNYSFIHVILKERAKEWSAVLFFYIQQAPMEDLEQTKEYIIRFFHKQTNWFTFPCSGATQIQLYRCISSKIKTVFHFFNKDIIYWHLMTIFNGVEPFKMIRKATQSLKCTSLQSKSRFWLPTSSFKTSTW